MQGFNAQAAIDNGVHRIVPDRVTVACINEQQVAPALEQRAALEAVTRRTAGNLADTGYFSADNLAPCKMAEMTPSILSRYFRVKPTGSERLSRE